MGKGFGEYYNNFGYRVTNENFQNLNLQVDKNNGIYFFWKSMKSKVKGVPEIFVSVISNNGSETVFQKIQLTKKNTRRAGGNLIENLNTTFNSNNNKEKEKMSKEDYDLIQRKIKTAMTKFWDTVEEGKYLGYIMSGINMKQLREQKSHNAEEPNIAEEPEAGPATTGVSHWTAAQDDESGSTYYYNSTTGETAWEIPTKEKPTEEIPTEEIRTKLDACYDTKTKRYTIGPCNGKRGGKKKRKGTRKRRR